jgi:microcystin-dependent protein
MSQFVAEIRIFPFNFPPTGWAFCNGQLLPISQNTALFSLLGTMYGGDGKSTFALPDIQGRGAMHQGSGPGLEHRFIGEASGSATVTLLISEMPAHTHTSHGKVAGGQSNPANMVWGTSNAAKAAANFYAPTALNGKQMHPGALAHTGGSLPHNNLMPYLALNFCIALQGIFPQRP